MRGPVERWCRVVGLVLFGLPAAQAQPAAAAASAPLLPPAAQVQQVLARTPAFAAALQDIEQAQAQGRQWMAGEPAWAANAALARRNIDDSQPVRNSEWELGLQRNLRLPGKQAAFERAGRSRLEQARAQVLKAWREQARQLLDLCGQWWRDSEASRLWEAQVDLLRQQRDAVGRRQRIGTAAALEQHQAEAALAQARAQAELASGRAVAVRQVLARRYPGLELPPLTALAPPAPLPGDDGPWLQRLAESSVEVAAARGDLAHAEAQRGVDEAERRPDPTVALRVGSARNGLERLVGVSISIPFGSDARQAVAQAAAARALAAESLLDDARRQAESAALQRLAEARTTLASWQAQAEAARRLGVAADGMARAYQLGEGSLTDLLAARRQANEGQVALQQGVVDAWLARHRVELESGLLWPPPDALTGRAGP